MRMVRNAHQILAGAVKAEVTHFGVHRCFSPHLQFSGVGVHVKTDQGTAVTSSCHIQKIFGGVDCHRRWLAGDKADIYRLEMPLLRQLQDMDILTNSASNINKVHIF